jgi:putative proteasome-type protease
MAYCIGVMLDKGMIFASDSRTNAGMDSVAKFCKMTVFARPGNRVIVLLCSGNLAGTQAVISVLTPAHLAWSRHLPGPGNVGFFCTRG